MNAKLHLRYVQEIRKGGRAYYYFRRGDVRIALPGAPGTREFGDAYQAALTTPTPPIGADKIAPGSVAALAAAWYASPGFTKLTAQSQRTYRRLLEGYLVKGGPRPVAQVEPRHILASIEKRAETPAQANGLLTVLKLMFAHGFRHGWRKDNPAKDVQRLAYKRNPYPTWTEGDIAAFEARWPVGSRARLALALLLYTGQRRSDVIRMGPQHVRAGVLDVVQQKTGVRLSIPVHPALAEAIAAHSRGHLAFLMTERAQPFASGTAFYNWFTWAARQAGIDKGMSPHGLRKAAARRLAQAGCSVHEIMSITGHRSLAEVQRYTREVEQERLARGAVLRLTKPADV